MVTCPLVILTCLWESEFGNASGVVISSGLCQRWYRFNVFWYLRKFPIIFLSDLSPGLPEAPDCTMHRTRGQPCQLLYQRWFHKTYKLCQRWFQFNDFWYLRKFPIIFLSRLQPWPPWNPRQHQASYQGQPCQLLCQRWFHKTLRTLSNMISNSMTPDI